jgi:uncharacterized lipoprotein YmbA
MSMPALPRALFAGFLAILGTQACRSPQVTFTYHQLHALAEAQSGARSTLALEVLPVRLPGLLRRPQLVLPGAVISDTHRWGNGLEQDVQRILVENLSRLLGSDAVLAYPYGGHLPGAYRILVDVDQWGFELAGTVTFRATWILEKVGKEGAICIRKSRLQEPLKDSGPDSLVAAQDRLLLGLSRELAAEVKLLK